MRGLGRRGADPDLERRLADVERELARLSPQVAAIEQRLADLADRLDAAAEATGSTDPGTPEDRAEARSVLDDVRREHAQVRARISAAVVYEERLRVLEERAGIDGLTGRPTQEPDGPAGRT